MECKTLRHVVSSSAEAEVAGIFHNATTAIPIRHMLQALNHPQPPTPLKTDNSTATGFIYDNIHQKRSKSWNMRYHWLRDKQTQQQFNIFWQPGTSNEADYHTKHHPTKHHREKRSRYVGDKLIQFLHMRCPARVCWYVIMTSQWHHNDNQGNRTPHHRHPFIECRVHTDMYLRTRYHAISLQDIVDS